MTRIPRITEESVLTRWMGMEVARINEGLVAERKTLASLLDEESPSAGTRGGGVHRFDREVLALLGGRLPEGIRTALRLPIVFFFDVDVRDSCYLADEAGVEALKSLGELGEGRKSSGGKLWVSRAIAFAIARRYPTVVQFAMA